MRLPARRSAAVKLWIKWAELFESDQVQIRPRAASKIRYLKQASHNSITSFLTITNPITLPNNSTTPPNLQNGRQHSCYLLPLRRQRRVRLWYVTSSLPLTIHNSSNNHHSSKSHMLMRSKVRSPMHMLQSRLRKHRQRSSMLMPRSSRR